MSPWSLILGKFRNQCGTRVPHLRVIFSEGHKGWGIYPSNPSVMGGGLLRGRHWFSQFLLAVGTGDWLPGKVLWPLVVWLPCSLGQILWGPGDTRSSAEGKGSVEEWMKLLEGLFFTLEPLCGDPQQRHIMNLPHKERGSWVGCFSERFLLDCEFFQIPGDKSLFRTASRQILQVGFCGHS